MFGMSFQRSLFVEYLRIKNYFKKKFKKKNLKFKKMQLDSEVKFFKILKNAWAHGP